MNPKSKPEIKKESKISKLLLNPQKTDKIPSANSDLKHTKQMKIFSYDQY